MEDTPQTCHPHLPHVTPRQPPLLFPSSLLQLQLLAPPLLQSRIFIYGLLTVGAPYLPVVPITLLPPSGLSCYILIHLRVRHLIFTLPSVFESIRPFAKDITPFLNRRYVLLLQLLPKRLRASPGDREDGHSGPSIKLVHNTRAI